MKKNSKKQGDIDRLMQFMFEVGTLRKVVRAHRQTLMTDDLSDNIASHTFRVAIIGYLLAKMESVDAYKVILMCLLHDIRESRSGDQNWVNKKYVKVFEEEILEDQLANITKDNELYKVALEYEKRESKESKIAKDADLLDQVLLLKEYAERGIKEAQSWLDSGEQEKMMYSKTTRAIAKKVKKNKIHCWWDSLWTADRRK